jgi:hypothetical protein
MNNNSLILCLPNELTEFIYDNIGNWKGRLSFASTNSHLFQIAMNKRKNLSFNINRLVHLHSSSAVLPVRSAKLIKPTKTMREELIKLNKSHGINLLVHEYRNYYQGKLTASQYSSIINKCQQLETQYNQKLNDGST